LRRSGSRDMEKLPEYRNIKEVIERVFHFRKMYCIDSAILPLAIYFEPVEIAAACIALGYKLFKTSCPNNRHSNVAKTGSQVMEEVLGPYTGIKDDMMGLDFEFKDHG